MAALALILPIGCGGDESRSQTEPQRLSAAEESVLRSSQAALHSYCRKVGLYLSRRQPLPTPFETEQVNGELDRLIALVHQKPNAQIKSRETLRSLLGDMAEDLEGSDCSGALERKLDQAFATLPQR